MRNKFVASGVTLISGSLLAGCGGAVAPQAQLTDAKSAVSAAQARGAKEVPQASLYLKMARDAVATAEELIKQEEYEQAEMVLERAMKDAKLASTLTDEAEMKKKAEEELKRLESLKNANAQLARAKQLRG